VIIIVNGTSAIIFFKNLTPILHQSQYDPFENVREYVKAFSFFSFLIDYIFKNNQIIAFMSNEFSGINTFPDFISYSLSIIAHSNDKDHERS
jgi:hypothetical protein